jgi:methanogenic corrinoid protein MtbC1
VYRRYTLDEVKRKIVDALQGAGAGLSGIELSDKTGMNRMTITKYLDVMHAIGLVKKKKIGNVNVWFLEIGVADIEFPVNYTQVQQKLINAILAGDEGQARRILLSVLLNSDIDQVKVLTDVVMPAVNTIGELYSRGKLDKTERTFLLTIMMELIDLVKFNVHPSQQKSNANVIVVAGSEDKVHAAKSAAVVFSALGWNSLYIGNVEEQIDPFFDIDFQRYISRVLGSKHGIMLVCIFSSGEGSLRFLSSTAKAMKGRLRGELRIAVLATPELQAAAEENSDHVANDLLPLVQWAEREYSVASS